jgi:hypothetical protein
MTQEPLAKGGQLYTPRNNDKKLIDLTALTYDVPYAWGSVVFASNVRPVHHPMGHRSMSIE